jgi:hypothetical protein
VSPTTEAGPAVWRWNASKSGAPAPAAHAVGSRSWPGPPAASSCGCCSTTFRWWPPGTRRSGAAFGSADGFRGCGFERPAAGKLRSGASRVGCATGPMAGSRQSSRGARTRSAPWSPGADTGRPVPGWPASRSRRNLPKGWLGSRCGNARGASAGQPPGVAARSGSPGQPADFGQKVAYVLVDMSGIPVVDSAGLGALIGGIRRTRELGGDVAAATWRWRATAPPWSGCCAPRASIAS